MFAFAAFTTLLTAAILMPLAFAALTRTIGFTLSLVVARRIDVRTSSVGMQFNQQTHVAQLAASLLHQRMKLVCVVRASDSAGPPLAVLASSFVVTSLAMFSALTFATSVSFASLTPTVLAAFPAFSTDAFEFTALATALFACDFRLRSE